MATINAALVERLDDELEADLQPEGRLGKVRRYLNGDQDDPYTPKGATKEYKHLAKASITNWTPLIVDTYSKGLFVDGYRPTNSADNMSAWGYWQKNGLDARQGIAHRGALSYGTSYVLVLPGDTAPVIRPLSPLRSLALYKDNDDEFPEVGFRRIGSAVDGSRIVEVFDDTYVYTFTKAKGDDSAWAQDSSETHGAGVVPFVRFRDRLDDDAVGVVRPLIPLQTRINEIVFSTLIAIQYASFRQKWATGLAIPEDAEGNPVEPFQAAVDRLWVSEDTETKFGEFAQTELSGHLSAYEASVRTMAAVAQVSPNIMTGDLVNLSAEALAQMEAATQRKISEYETLFGEAWESVFRLAAQIAGDSAVAEDTDAQVRWRDTEARSMAQTVDALGKMAQMLSVPVDALWERIPGVTDQDVEYWRTLRDQGDPVADLIGEFSRQGEDPAAPSEAQSEAEDLKAKADAMGVLIRSGVSPEAAARQVGLGGIEFSDLIPASLKSADE